MNSVSSGHCQKMLNYIKIYCGKKKKKCSKHKVYCMLYNMKITVLTFVHQRHFTVLAVSTSSPETLSSMFGSILGFHLQRLPFSPAVVSSGPAVVKAAVALHDRMIQLFLPTSNKFYCLFNLWDLSRLFQVSIPSVPSNFNCIMLNWPTLFICVRMSTQGLLFSRPECVRQGVDLVRLWIHESRRVYSDRFSEPSDLQLFRRLQTDIARQTSEVNQQNKMCLLLLNFCSKVFDLFFIFKPFLNFKLSMFFFYMQSVMF